MAVETLKLKVDMDNSGLKAGAKEFERAGEQMGKSLQKGIDKSSKSDKIKERILDERYGLDERREYLKNERKRLAGLQKRREDDLRYSKHADVSEYDSKIATSEGNIAQAKTDIIQITENIRELRRELAAAQKEEANVGSASAGMEAVSGTVNKIGEKTKELAKSAQDAAQSEKQLAGATRDEGNAQDEAAAKTERHHRSHGRSLGSMIRSVFIYRTISRMLNMMRAGLANVITSDSAMAASLASIRGSLYSAFAPIVSFVLPALRSLLAVLAQVMAAIAHFIGAIFGMSGQAQATAGSLLQQAAATEAAGGAAGGAAKTIAAFDEINQMNDSGGGGGGGGGLGYDFTGTAESIDLLNDKFRETAAIVAGIAAAIIAWKLSHSFTKALGAFFLIYGIVGKIGDTIKAWKDGLQSINLDKLHLHDLSIVLGLLLLFGPKAAAIGAIAAGLSDVVVAIKDIVENGANLENVSTLIWGIGLAVVGISALIGNPIGFIIGIILLLAGLIISKWDWIEENVIKPIEAYVDLVGQWFSLMWTNVKQNFIEPLVEGAKGIWDWITVDLPAFIASVPEKLGELWDAIKLWFALTGLKLALKAAEFWNNIKEGASNLWEKVTAPFKALWAMVSLWFSTHSIKDLAKALWDGFINGLSTIWDSISGFFSTIWTNIKNWFTGGEGGESHSIATLASDMWGGFTNGLSEIWGSISGFFDTIWTNITNWFNEKIEAIKNLANALWSAITGSQNDNGDNLVPMEDAAITLDVVSNLDATAVQLLAQSGEKIAVEIDGEIKEIDAAEAWKLISEQASTQGEADGASYSAGFTTGAGDITSPLYGRTSGRGGGHGGRGGGTHERPARKAGQADGEEYKAGFESVDVDTDFSSIATDAQTAMTTVITIFQNAQTTITAIMTNIGNVIRSAFSSSGSVGASISAGLSSMMRRYINGMISGINSSFGVIDSLTSQLSRLKSIRVGGTFPFASIPTIRIPRIAPLAQGAVIPANNRFLAMLGDQTSGTNIEAPLDTIVEAVRTALGGNGGNTAQEIRQALQGMHIEVNKRVLGYLSADGINENRRIDGKLALNL